MTKILNIDGLTKAEFAITLGGVSYTKKEMSVADFIKLNGMAEAIDAKPNLSNVDHANFLVDSIAVSFPDCPREVLIGCTLVELNIIAKFAKDGSLPEDAVIVDPSGDEKKAPKAS